jgi:hypothetical protein
MTMNDNKTRFLSRQDFPTEEAYQRFLRVLSWIRYQEREL